MSLGTTPSSSDTVKTFATQHYTYMDEHIKELLFSVNWLLAHAHNIANNNKCAFTGKFIGLEGSNIVIYYKLQTIVHGRPHTKAQVLWFDVLCNFDAHIDSILWPMVHWICPPSHVYLHWCCKQQPVCLCLDAYDPHILEQTRLHDGPGTFLGKQPLSEGQMELSLFHAELTPSEPPPTHSPPNVLPDHYIPDLSFDSDSDATVQDVEPEEPIADNDGIINPDYSLPSSGDDSSSRCDSLLDLD